MFVSNHFPSAGTSSGLAPPRPPLLTPPAPPEPEEPDEAELDAALCAGRAEEEAALEGAECDFGCDYPDGPLSPSGCRW